MSDIEGGNDSDFDGEMVAALAPHDNNEDGSPPGLEEVCNLFKPYLRKQDNDHFKKLRDKLRVFGAVTLSHVQYLIESDLDPLVSMADFRACISKFEKEQSAPSE